MAKISQLGVKTLSESLEQVRLGQECDVVELQGLLCIAQSVVAEKRGQVSGEEMCRLDEIRGHLGAALAQSLSSDDQVIMQHVRDAFVLAGGKLEWLSSQRG